jgi:hypothetical protein
MLDFGGGDSFLANLDAHLRLAVVGFDRRGCTSRVGNYVIDGQHEDAEHQAAEYLGVARAPAHSARRNHP